MSKASYHLDKTLVLGHIPFFSELNFFERRLVRDSIKIVEFKKSQLIYRQGSAADAFYCILSGRVEIFIERGKDEETLEHIHRGKYFGFISLLTSDVHSVSTRAATDVLIAKIEKDDFNIILKSIPKLAIELSRMLSRRLKHREAHPKTIFESTIVAVYSDEALLAERYFYALTLGLGLRQETHKKIILITIGNEGGSLPDGKQGFSAIHPLFSLDEVSKKIIRHEKGIDILPLEVAVGQKPTTAFVISLLTTLVNDYNYCIIHFGPDFGVDAFKILTQTDVIHLLVSQDQPLLSKTLSLLEASGVWNDASLKKKIKLIMLEDKMGHGKSASLAYHEEASMFHQPIFATLPYIEDKAKFIEKRDVAQPYAKVIRRIARQTGEVLVGLGLGSGSAMGLAHVGVIKVLESEGIPIDTVSGCSIGALIGALWCYGYTAAQVEEIILENRNKPYIFGLDDLTLPLHGLIRGHHVKRFLKKYLQDKTFHDIKRPLKIVAVDCLSMRRVVFDSGKLVDAVMASLSIPGVFEPYRIGRHYYVDGGILDPLPTDVLVESGVKKIIAVNVLPSSDEIERTYEQGLSKGYASPKKQSFFSKYMQLPKKKLRDFLMPSIFDVIVSSVQSMQYSIASFSSMEQADISLHPDMSAVLWNDFGQAPELIKRGEEETRLHLEEIREIIARPD